MYALFAVGYTLVFGVLDILNLAHAAIYMAAAFAAFSLARAGLPLGLAFAAPRSWRACSGSCSTGSRSRRCGAATPARWSR